MFQNTTPLSHSWSIHRGSFGEKAKGSTFGTVPVVCMRRPSATRAKRSGSAGLVGRTEVTARISKTDSVTNGMVSIARIRSQARSREVGEKDKGDNSGGRGNLDNSLPHRLSSQGQ